MRKTISVPCVQMRGGTSKGPFFLASDLPADIAARDEVLIAAMGSGHPRQIDGIGGGTPVTSKVAIISKGTFGGAQVDYLFAQVFVEKRLVDTSPNCGNMLTAVGPFAIEAGLVPAQDGITPVLIHNVNTGKLIEARVQTPGGVVTYDGDASIDGVPGTAAPVELAFLDSAGAKTGKLLPTGNAIDMISGVEASCIDCAMPMVMFRAADFGKTGYETATELDADKAFFEKLEPIRIEAGKRMGFGDVTDIVIPKPVLLSPARNGGTINARYFMPHDCHPSLAVTGSIGIATACCQPGTLAGEIAGPVSLPTTMRIEHPSGAIVIGMEPRDGSNYPVASLTRTARRLFDGRVFASIEEGLAIAAE